MHPQFKSGIKIGLVTHGIGLFYVMLSFTYFNPRGIILGELPKGILIFLFVLAVAWSIVNLLVLLKKRFRNGSLGILSINLTYIFCYILVFLIIPKYF